jgi:hypothetical protein
MGGSSRHHCTFDMTYAMCACIRDRRVYGVTRFFDRATAAFGSVVARP